MKFLCISLIAILGTALYAIPIPETVEMCPMHAGMTMTEMVTAVRIQQDPQEPSQDEPEGNPGHEVPVEFCRPTSIEGRMPCMCLSQHADGCREGKREIETRVCMSYCWKKFCKCCSS